ncbi:beta-N-acetylhexosaminidase family protein [Streptomyces celluloflavus]|uniref:beta-N-acetylhexosaminidase family protein n=1 Tax=Streptomyces celluloflavus TaxID=58344 RepID=UPI00369C314E
MIRRRTVTAWLGSALLLAGCAPLDKRGSHGYAAGPRSTPDVPSITRTSVTGNDLPRVSPTPQQIRRTGPDLSVPLRVDLLTAQGTDARSVTLVKAALRRAGATDVRVSPLSGASPPAGPLTVVIGTVSAPHMADKLGRSKAFTSGTLPPEGYQITTGNLDGHTGVLLAGADGDGVFYAAQTFTRLATDGRIAGATVVDHPAMPLRGVVEGFYGKPWTHEERLDQIAFYGSVKLNTYLYAPKDDPYERDRWRERYPRKLERELAELAQHAVDHHVRFTYVLSPGKSITYNDAGDRQALTGKLQSLYNLGIRDFALAFDDIHPLPVWNGAADFARYGPVSEQSAAAAQADLTNRIQREFVDQHRGMRPLQFVPTQYSDLADTPYKKTLRRALDDRVQVWWTGADVVPTSITTAQTRRAADVWGHDVLLWDNYPTNDYDHAAGRLLLAPYAKRTPRLGEHLSGVALNPMNQASASKIAEFTGADYAWNPHAYRPTDSWHSAAAYMTAHDPQGTQALLTFLDTQYMAPSWTGTPWQPAAPALKARLDAIERSWRTGRKHEAVTALRAQTRSLAEAPTEIRRAVTDPGFAAETKPWLDALTLWAKALEHTCDGLEHRAKGEKGKATRSFTAAAELAREAAAVRTIPGATRPHGNVKVADGVLDTFIRRATKTL